MVRRNGGGENAIVGTLVTVETQRCGLLRFASGRVEYIGSLFLGNGEVREKCNPIEPK